MGIVESGYRNTELVLEPPKELLAYDLWDSARVNNVTLGENQHTFWSSFLMGNGHTFGHEDLDDSSPVNRAVYITGKQCWIRQR